MKNATKMSFIAIRLMAKLIRSMATNTAARTAIDAIKRREEGKATKDAVSYLRLDDAEFSRVAAGSPIEAITASETIFVPEDMVGRRDTYVLQVKGDSMIDEQIRDGDFVIVENRKHANDGEMVIALLDGDSATLKKIYREGGGMVRLQPANARVKPILVDQDRLSIQGVVIGVLRKY